VTLTSATSLNLSAHYWYPIGGVSPIASGVPTGYYFAGTFNGSNVPIDGLFIEAITPATNNSGYGLFGYVNGGTLENIYIQNDSTIGGAIDLGTNAISAVGAIVGYTNGSVLNCINEIPITIDNTDASGLGGIAGTIENRAASGTITISQSKNIGDLTGGSRIGGIAGAVYAGTAGNVIIDQCVNKNNELITVGSTTKSFLGGISGLCQGYITNSYSYKVTIQTSGGHYQGGIAGDLQGEQYGTRGAMSNCYSYAIFGAGAVEGYDAYLASTVDNSNTVPIINSLFVDTYRTGETPVSLDYNIGDGVSGWGLWTQTGYFWDATNGYTSTTGAQVYTAAVGPTTAVALTVLNSSSTILPTTAAYDNTLATNNGYPYLRWE
jgi:hypothetical protein